MLSLPRESKKANHCLCLRVRGFIYSGPVATETGKLANRSDAACRSGGPTHCRSGL